MFAIVYLLSLLVMGFTIAGILVSTPYGTAGTITLRSVWAMAISAFVPVINTFLALFIIGLIIWLLFFKHR